MKAEKTYLFLIILMLISVTGVYSQADISMSTHWYNKTGYNPASISRPDYIYFFGNVRKQWIGINGAPTVFNVQASGMDYEYHSAYGISLVSDQIGATYAINPMLSYAYTIRGRNDWWLSLGIAGGVFSRTINATLYEADDQTDDILYKAIDPVTSPDVDIGAEFQSRYWVFGLSSTHVLSIGKTDNTYLNTNHIYGYAIYKNTYSELFNFNLGVQTVYRNGLTVLEGNGAIRFKYPTGLQSGPREIFDIGATFRSSNQLTLLAGIYITNNIRVGYTYDQSFNTGYIANSTHEIAVEVRFDSKKASAFNSHNDSFWYY